jgi:hypothetical protein
MNTMRLIRHSAGMMRRHKLRTGFMMIGSFIGVAALTLVISVGLAAGRKLLKLAHQMFGESSLMIIDGGRHMMGGPRNPGKRLRIDDLDAIGKQVPEIESWDAQQGLTVSVVTRTLPILRRYVASRSARNAYGGDLPFKAPTSMTPRSSLQSVWHS